MFKGKTWIFLVLTSFILLLVPKMTWHDCEQLHEKEHQDDPNQKSFQSGDCDICDFELFTAIVHPFTVFRFAKIKHLNFNFHAKSQCIVPLSLLKLRGPPNN